MKIAAWNLMVTAGWSRSPSSWTAWISGSHRRFDFEPAMRGAFEYEYEFVGAGIFVTKGNQTCWKAMVDAYGRTPDPRRVMAYTLLHVYGNVPWFMKGMPEAGTLDELAVRWFGQ